MITDLSHLKSLESWASRKTLVTCLNVIQETPDVKTFQFVAKPAQLFHFKPGQFIGIQLEIAGKKYNRSYTVASSPTRPHVIDLTVKLDNTGKVSPWLHDHVRPGTELEFRGPAGKFNCLDISSDKVLLISAGSGITPMMSMARFWCDQAVSKDIQFLSWARSTEDIIFRRELALMDYQNPHFSLEVICTQPGLKENWLGRRGRINSNLLLELVPDLTERTVFCCGPEAFMLNVKSCLQALNFDMNAYHDESFDPGGKKKASQIETQQPVNTQDKKLATGPFNLTFSKTGKTVSVEATENLLERIEAEGIAIESSCRTGNCGACQVNKVSGEVITVNETGLHQDRKNEGYILTCTTYLKSDVTLDI